jgi:hypothetical protein
MGSHTAFLAKGVAEKKFFRASTSAARTKLYTKENLVKNAHPHSGIAHVIRFISTLRHCLVSLEPVLVVDWEARGGRF